jgi:CHAT domain
MFKIYYTYRIRVANYQLVQVEKSNSQHQSLGQPSGKFRSQDNFTPEIAELLICASTNELNDADKARLLGEALFDSLFDDVLRQDFVNFYNDVKLKKQLLRVELDIDEQNMPEVAALPWEFMCLPQSANLGTIWLGTTPDIVLSRRRLQWISAQPITLSTNERLRIALVVSAPSNLGNVEYQRVQEALEKLASEAVQVELLPVVNQANPEAVDDILAKKPHIFHFIGHGRFENEKKQQVGEIAFVDDFGEAMWVDAGYFSQLFNRHCPGVVMLQACEGGSLSDSQAFVGVASRVVQQNIPVVVAMQYEVSNATASRFACSFYKRLAQGNPVDIAVQEGRYAIALSSTQYRKRDFAAPVIFMRVEDGYLFKLEDISMSSSNIEEILQPKNDKLHKLLLEKLAKFQRDRIITADSARQFELDRQIEEIKQQLAIFDN